LTVQQRDSDRRPRSRHDQSVPIATGVPSPLGRSLDSPPAPPAAAKPSRQRRRHCSTAALIAFSPNFRVVATAVRRGDDLAHY